MEAQSSWLQELETLWPHQAASIDAIDAAIGAGHKNILLTIPTGGGKTRIMQVLAKTFVEMMKRVSLYTNRRLLIEQTSAVMMAAGIYHGVRAAGYPDERDHPFQISSFQTEHARSIKSGHWELHDADLVEVDEAHLQKGDTAIEIFRRHQESGAVRVGFTATPVDLDGMYDHLIVGARVSELRKCGALVPAYNYGPDEPDLKDFKRQGKTIEAAEDVNPCDLSEKAIRQLIPPAAIFGRVWDHFNLYNPDRRPTLLFGPDVGGSLWFAKKFTENGVRAAHIDGDSVWIDGELHQGNAAMGVRNDLLVESKAGKLPVICNRFVMREGIDAPWLSHGIFATIFSSIQSYLQSGGRFLRACDGKTHCTIQDHGGNWWRHGSLNADREWDLRSTSRSVYRMRAEAIREGKEPRPFRCPKCGRTWNRGPACPTAHGGCGFVCQPGEKLTRPVISTDGTLREMSEVMFKPRRICTMRDGIYDWKVMLKRGRSKGGRKTFLQGEALFAREHYGQYPDRNWPGMPIDKYDWQRYMDEVPDDRLR